MTESERDTLTQRAKFAEQAERYEDMVAFMIEVTKLEKTNPKTLTDEERNLLSVAFKNEVGARRSAWRIISAVEQKDVEKNDSKCAESTKAYRIKIEGELQERCTQVLTLIDEYLLPGLDEAPETDSDKALDSKVFYLKMKGDYFRYLVEVSVEEAKNEFKNKSNEAYKSATASATALPATHPIKLGLALNYSVFHYEIQSDAKEACTLAKKAFDDAIAELDSLKEDSYKDSTLIMQLLRDNLTLWTSERDDDEEEEGA